MATNSDDPTGDGVEHETAAAYDLLPYPSRPHPFSHPDCLAVIARLHGMCPPDVRESRVLEIGCSDGGNLLPVAFALPGTRCLGIDVSPRQVGMATRSAAALGLTNVEFRNVGILDFEPDERFDYILVHGVFSWVTEDVREQLLHLIRRSLSPQGLAYVSYNVYPGWHENELMRDMMLFHTRDMTDPGDRVTSALEFMRFAADATSGNESEAARRLRSFHSKLKGAAVTPTYLFHEYLEDHNDPMYFREFAQHAADVGLMYVGDADPVPFDVENLPPDTADQIRAWSNDRLDIEQYVDFIRNAHFRRSVLCRADVDLCDGIDASALETLYAATRYKPQPPPQGDQETGGRTFSQGAGEAFTASHPLTVQLLERLAAVWPTDCAIADLSSLAPAQDVVDTLLALFRTGVVQLRSSPAPCVATVSERPQVSRLARWQARRGDCVTNQLHCPVDLDDPAACFLLPLMDGTRDLRQVADRMQEAVSDDRLHIAYRGKPLAEQADLRSVLPKFAAIHAQKMADLALLVG